VRQAEANPPDLVLMDLRMPEMDGYEAARALRERAALRGVPIVAVTAAAFADDRDRALAAGVDAHLAKPVLLDALLETLGSLLSLEWVRSEAAVETAPAGLEALAPDRAAQLARLVETGSVTAVATLAKQWAREGCCPLLAHRIEMLTDEFDVAGLRRLLEEVGAAPGTDGGE
jgi:CheY-like chemotaxis protein